MFLLLETYLGYDNVYFSPNIVLQAFLLCMIEPLAVWCDSCHHVLPIYVMGKCACWLSQDHMHALLLQLPQHIEAEVPSTTWEITTSGPVGTQKSKWYCVDRTLVRLGADRRLTCQSAFCGRHCAHSKAVMVAFPGVAQDTDVPDDMIVMGGDEPEMAPLDVVNRVQAASCGYQYPWSSEDAQCMHDIELLGISKVAPSGHEERVLCSPEPEGVCSTCNQDYKQTTVRRNCTVYLPRPQYAQTNVSVAEWHCGCSQPQHKYNPRDHALWRHSPDVFISVR